MAFFLQCVYLPLDGAATRVKIMWLSALEWARIDGFGISIDLTVHNSWITSNLCMSLYHNILPKRRFSVTSELQKNSTQRCSTNGSQPIVCAIVSCSIFHRGRIGWHRLALNVPPSIKLSFKLMMSSAGDGKESPKWKLSSDETWRKVQLKK